MNKEDIKKILDAGVQAPSGENCQPWSFAVDLPMNTVYLFNLPEKDQSTYNFNQQGSLISHGCVIENIVIMASTQGYRVEVLLLPNNDEPNCVAKIIFEKSDVVISDELAEHIYSRVSNRKPYTQELLKSEEVLALTQEISGNQQLTLLSERAAINDLAYWLSASEQVLFENKTMHDFFFSHINWTLEEEQKKRYGFYVDTLELTAQQRKGFGLFKHWKALSILNLLGISKVVRKDNAKNYKTAGAVGFITGKENSPKEYVEAGRKMQRLWLRATKLGLAVQPLMGVVLINKKIVAGEANELSDRQKRLITRAQNAISQHIRRNDPIHFSFRIGRAPAATAHSLRKEPEVTFLTTT